MLLTVFDANGTQSFDQSTYEVTGYKDRQFSILPHLGGRVRHSDQGRAPRHAPQAESPDSGYGGTVDYQNVRVQRTCHGPAGS